MRTGSIQRGFLGAAFVAALLLLLPSGAAAFTVETNRGGTCEVNPRTSVGGNLVTYGLEVPSCDTRNGIKRIASKGLAIEGDQIVSSLSGKTGTAPYENLTTSARTLPSAGSDELPIDIPTIPDIPLIPDLPIDITVLPDLPIPGTPDAQTGRTYTRIDYSLQLERNRGKKAKRKPEKWRPADGCRKVTRKRTNDTLICKSFAQTSP